MTAASSPSNPSPAPTPNVDAIGVRCALGCSAAHGGRRRRRRDRHPGLRRKRHELDPAAIRSAENVSRRARGSRRTERVPIRRLDTAAMAYVNAEHRVFLKVDTQASSPRSSTAARRCCRHSSPSSSKCPSSSVYPGRTRLPHHDPAVGSRGLHPSPGAAGYFERKLGRMLEIDGVFVREAT